MGVIISTCIYVDIADGELVEPGGWGAGNWITPRRTPMGVL